MSFKNIMSVNVPRYAFHTKNEDPAEIYPYGFAQTSGELDAALDALANTFHDMLELAEVEKTMQLLAADIEKTRRRVNALEYVMIPGFQEKIRYIVAVRVVTAGAVVGAPLDKAGKTESRAVYNRVLH